jgi:signal transduction histidine kinase
MLKTELKNNSKITRIENSVEKILNLQKNLKAYLKEHKFQNEEFYLDEIIMQSIELIEKNFPDIKYMVDVKHIKLYTNKEAFVRILDNLISNASKYNKKNSSVKIYLKNDILHIQDFGKGIKNPSKVFERFYKEQERGIGIGLHIVKKLCNELNIKISLKSQINKGTTFYLDIKNLTFQ